MEFCIRISRSVFSQKRLPKGLFPKWQLLIGQFRPSETLLATMRAQPDLRSWEIAHLGSCHTGKISLAQGFHSQNETQNFSFFAHQFCAKINNLRNHSQKSFRAKLPFTVFAKLKFCAIPQFRKNQTVGDGVCFLEFNSSSAGRFCTKIQNRLSSKSLDNFSFGHAYFLKVDSSGIGYFLALFYMRLKRFQKFDLINLRI